MDSYRIINSPLGVGLALSLSRGLPPGPGRRLARAVAHWLASRQGLPIVRAVRLNQWVVSGGRLTGQALDEAVYTTFQHTAQNIYTLYHNLNDHTGMERLVEFSPQAEALVRASQAAGSGMIVVGVHMSNFDLVARLAGRRGLRALVLALPQPGSGYRWQNRMRREAGLEILPASLSALRLASRRLQAGETVLTGIDRPLPYSKYRPRFFGRPAALPVMHINLALQTGVPIVVAAALMGPDSVYRILTSDCISMRRHPDRRREIIQNAETVLEIGEDFIRQAPTQWAMFYPVWPEAEAELPG